MDITFNVNINTPELCTTIREVAVLLAKARAVAAEPCKCADTEESKSNFSFNLKDTHAELAQEEVKPDPTETKPAEDAQQQDQEPAKETTNTEAPAVTLEQVRTKLAALSQAGKQAQVKEIITKFGAKKLTDIPAEKFAEVLAAAEKL